MATTSPLRRIGLFPVILIVTGWAGVIWAVLNMGSPVVRLMMPMSTDWTGAQFFMVWLMWAMMMAAMMLPSALPMIAAHSYFSSRYPTSTRAHNYLFIVSYLTVWSLFSLVAACTQWGLQAAGVLSHMLVVAEDWLAAVILIAAGLTQFSTLKDRCLRTCRTPVGFLTTEWRPGLYGAFRTGFYHGVFCVGCCWALMAVLFVFGVMNLMAIGLLAVAVAAEKLLPSGVLVSRIIGAGLSLWGVSLFLV